MTAPMPVIVAGSGLTLQANILAMHFVSSYNSRADWKGLVDISLNLDSRLDDFHATW